MEIESQTKMTAVPKKNIFSVTSHEVIELIFRTVIIYLHSSRIQRDQTSFVALLQG